MNSNFIKKISNDEYIVYSSDGFKIKNCDSLVEAEDILVYAKEVELSYSAIMRELNKNNKEDIEQFRRVFKKTFDEANIEGLENADKIALMTAIKSINYLNKEAKFYNRMYKLASEITEIGDPDTAGKGIASIVKFLLKKIDPMNRQQTTNKLRDRIWRLNEIEMASKKSPKSASIGQSVAFIKNVLNGRDPKYIREVLRHIVGYL